MLSHLDRIVTEAEFVVAKLSAMAAQLVPAAEIHCPQEVPGDDRVAAGIYRNSIT